MDIRAAAGTAVLVLVLTRPAAAQLRADQLIEAGHWKKARAIVEARIREAPEDPQAYFLLSQIRNAFGDSSSPLALAEKAVVLDGRTARYHRQLAEVIGVTARHSNAFRQLLLARRFRKELDAALALDPRDVQALRDLVEFYLLAPGIAGGDRRKAESTAEQIAAINAVEGLLARARIAAFLKRPADAENLLRMAAEIEPPSYRARIELARSYLEPERLALESAESAARKAVRLDAARVDGWEILATVYAARGAWSELDATLASAQRECPDDRVPYYRAAERLAGRDPERAGRYLRLYIAQEPEGNRPTTADGYRLLQRLGEMRQPVSGAANREAK